MAQSHIISLFFDIINVSSWPKAFGKIDKKLDEMSAKTTDKGMEAKVVRFIFSEGSP